MGPLSCCVATREISSEFSMALLECFGIGAQHEIPQSARCELPNYTFPKCASTVLTGGLYSAILHSTVLLFQEDRAHIHHICTQPTPHALLDFLFFLSTFPSPLSSLISFFFFLFFFWIGLIPCSLACPIIFWNIQGNVSSCCHSNYSNIQHGS